MDAEFQTRLLEGNHVDTNFIALAAKNVPEVMKESAKALDELLADIKARQADRAREIVKKLGLSGDQIPAQGVKYGDLSKDVKDRLLSQIGADWQSYGFASRQEAESFLLNSDSLQVTTSIGLAHCERPSDPANRIPAVYGTYIFTKVAGGIAP
jgi:hypothetical protein